MADGSGWLSLTDVEVLNSKDRFFCSLF